MQILKKSGFLLGLLILAYGGIKSYGMFIMNPNVINEIRSNPDGERAGIVMLLTLPSGKQIPVNYLREGKNVFVGADGPWWKEFRDEGGIVNIELRGEKLTGQAKAILDDPDYTKLIFKRLRPTVPKWLPDWLNGKLVVITLSP